MPAGTQGSKEPVDVLGDIVIDLDEEFQVAGGMEFVRSPGPQAHIAE